jgi:hypothetical protein
MRGAGDGEGDVSKDRDTEWPAVPRVALPTETLIMEGNDQILWIDGVLSLPIGARINLDNVAGLPQLPLAVERFPRGRADAVVTGVRLWGTMGAGRVLVLEVQIVGVDERSLPPLS